jgi:phosphatidylinositol-3-phosphatase
MGAPEHSHAARFCNRLILHACGMFLLFFGIMACGGSGGGSNSGSSSNPGSPNITSVTAACTPSSIATNATAECTATVKGSGNYSSAVQWSASSGAVNSNGVFTAPATAGSITVTATSIQNPSESGSTSIRVTAQQSSSITSVQASCNPSTISANGSSQCSAMVAGTGSYSSAVTWSASGGTITSSGLFTAPASSGSVTVTAASVQDSAVSGKTIVTVQSKTSPPPQTAHIVMVMEENQSYATVVRNTTDWPNLNQLIANGALPTKYFANTHPSIGNYFMLTTGQVLTNDDSSTTVWDVDNLARRMLAANIPFRVYAEGISRGYVGGNTGPYLVRHNPFALLSEIASNPQVANQCIWPFSQFATDLANGTLPEFSFIVPDVNDDAHNGTPLQADSWLQANVVLPLSNNSAFASGGDGLLIVNFDEAADSDTRNGGGKVAPVFWGPLAKVGYTQNSTTLYQHQSMLRTMMEVLGLANPPAAAASAPSMSEFLQK